LLTAGALIGGSPFSAALVGDGDNFAKLVLDSMNCIMVVDNTQAKILKVIKMVNDCGMCDDSMEVIVHKLKARDICLALSKMIWFF
jgi:hypothetical protein